SSSFDSVATRGPGVTSRFDLAVTRDGAHRRDLVRSAYPHIVGRAMQHIARVQVAAWDRALRNVRRAQEKTLTSVLEHAKETDFGRAHRFGHLRGYDDFARHVPVGDYDSFAPYIDRMRAGERNLLIPEFVEYFGHSSGSSNHGRPKFLPISDRQIRFQQRAGADTVMRYLRSSKDDEMLCGFTLGLFPPTTMRREGPVWVTSNPALMMTKMPAFTRPVYLPDEDVRTIANYDDKLRVIAERYIDHDVRAITGTTCWFTLLFEKVLAAARARGRSARTVSDIWPNLRVLFGGGVAAAPYLPVIRDFVGRDDVTLVDTYNATEGGVYAASDFTGARGLLMLPSRGTFFEFVPLEARERPSPPRVPLWSVQTGQPYSIVVTTSSGLYAYELGDIVRFTSVDPPRIEFMGRLSGCLSLTQELMTHVEIEHAVEFARLQCPCTTLEFGAAADVGVDGTAKSRYLLFVEFEEGAGPTDLDAFAAAFDRGLCTQNRVYREHRSGDVALLASRIVPLSRGGARLFLEEVTSGNVQGKFPRIVDDNKKKLLWKHAATVR
ncbi:MAG: GH3 auxin-responsive promoter family protein, partial [Myxococcota bacterium]|nr:GH3 auxin-responsive promoter family protein [Myxococcota bacterium]